MSDKEILSGLAHKEIQPCLRRIIDLLDKSFFPKGRDINITFRIPSSFLIDKGLVSQKTAEGISRGMQRAVQEIGQCAKNTVFIEPTTEKDGFIINEKYVDEEQIVEGGRLDRLVEEKMTLREKNEDKEISIVLEERVSGIRFKDMSGNSWKPAIRIEEDFKQVNVTERHILTTYAFVQAAATRMVGV
ncbi:MAG: hypothetical protein V1858_05410 [Candidatus Gottesmanbacteria bacterium]